MNRLVIIAAVIAAALLATASRAQVPENYPPDYGQIVEAAKKEGRVVVYATTDRAAANPLLNDFRAAFPGIRVDYSDLNSTELYNRFIAEAAAGYSSDVLWSSAMDLQVKLAADGNAITYASPELAALPQWAAWQNQAYGTTYEPITFVYNKRLLPAVDVPGDHNALLRLIRGKPDAFKGKLTAYDPEKSGVGYLLVNQDVRNFPQAWDLFKSFGKANIKLYTSAGAMLERVTSGEHILAYGIFGSYALGRARKVPSLGIITPKDYTVVTSRVAFISSKARNPNAAKVFLDYLLSKRGQTIIANEAGLYSLRDDVIGETTAKKVAELVGTRARPVPIGAELLTNLDEGKRLAFLKQWQDAMKGL